jgi:PAS domain S-box-containing protein
LHLLMKKNVLSNKYNIPPALVGITVFLCVLPTLLNLCGIRFGLANNLVDMDQLTVLNELETSKALHPLLNGRFIHTILVSFSISIAFLTVILAFIDYSIKKNVSTPIVGVALFCAGMLDMIHILTSDQVIEVSSSTTNITSFTWFFSRTFHALILILGVGIFLIQNKDSVKEEYRSEKRFVAYISVIFFLLTVNAILIVTDAYLKTPQMIYPDMIVKHPYDLIPLAIYLGAGIFIFPEFYRRNPSIFSQTLILSLIPAVVTQLHIAFGSSQLFDNHFFIAHYMKSVTYLVPFLGLSMNYIETHKNEQKADQEKQYTQEILQGILDSSLSGIISYKAIRDKSKKIIDFEFALMNPSSETISEFSRKEMIGKRLLEYYPQHKNSGLFQNFVNVVDHNAPMIFEQYAVRTQKWTNISAVKLGDGIAITYNDITQRKVDEERLKKSEGLYRSLAKNIPDSAVFLFDQELRYTLVDGTSLRDFGITTEQLIGKKATDMLQKKDQDLFIPSFEKALQGEETEFEYTFGSKHFHIAIIPVRNSEGEIFAGMSVARDITELKEYQNELESKIKELNRSNKELEQFAYVASHDLQEPLRKIQAFGDLLQMKYTEQMGADGETYINRMQNAASRMQVLIDDLLTFSRISSPKELFTEINLQDVIDGVLTDMEVSIEQDKVRIYADVKIDIEAIPGQIRQLFQNLISNAIKFKKPDQDPVIQITGEIIKGKGFKGLNSQQNYARIKITDNGIGFNEKYLDRIFVIFQRLHSRLEYEGTGIGLAICKKIVESHHGFITAESQSGQGTTFILALPIKQKHNE